MKEYLPIGSVVTLKTDEESDALRKGTTRNEAGQDL